MRVPAFIVLVSLTTTLASPTLVRKSQANHVIHEKRDNPASGWSKRDRVNPDAVLPVRFGLKQRNLHLGDGFLDEVSNPKSDKYARHWSAKEVVDMFAPSDESVSAVKTWLIDSGIDPKRITLTSTKSWITVDLTVSEAESLLKTEYHVYEHTSGTPHIASDSYSLPADLSAEHVDIVLPTVHFDVKVPGRGNTNDLRKRITEPQTNGIAKQVGQPNNTGSLPKLGAHVDPWGIITELKNCDKQIVPDCLRALYKFGPGISAHPDNSYGIVEYTPQAYRPEDLDMFFTNFSKHLVGSRPTLDSIDGGVVQQDFSGFGVNGESDLDLEYAMALVAPLPVTLYQVGDMVEGASFNNFLDGIDASYCTYAGGDDPNQDGIYPDPFGGYQGPQDCGTYKPTNVISTSYGYNEADLTPAYEVRQCYEYMKLGLQGVTVLYSSGDSGVAGNFETCLGPNGTYTFGEGGFNPSFPGGCPYVTSVGATQVPTGTDILKDLATGVQPEVACETVIYSGGGFSNVFGIPKYQAGAVSHYLSAYPPPYTSDQFNNSGKARAFPDISANGANYVVAVDSQFGLVYGTSASSPVVGSIITLINEARLAFGKKPVGFINPVLYQFPWVLNDVTNGTNPGCGTDGFAATPGWDPVTGLGTPNFPKLLGLFLSLP